MNPQGAKGIEYLTRTWNPATGCKHLELGVCKVDGCWAHNMARRNLPHLDDMTPAFHLDRLEEPLRMKKPQRIGVSYYGDLWGEWMPAEWIQAVLDVCREAHWHRFIFLTKNPLRYGGFLIPENCWCGTSISGDDDWTRLFTLAKNSPRFRRFISWEPCGGRGSVTVMAMDWLIIGGKSGSGAHQADPERVGFYLRQAAVSGLPVFLKDNSGWAETVQQYPADLILPWEK